MMMKMEIVVVVVDDGGLFVAVANLLEWDSEITNKQNQRTIGIEGETIETER